MDGQDTTIDLQPAIRDEIVLESPRYFLPLANDDQNCTRCGIHVDQFKRTQDETETEIDPRWSALTTFQTD